MNTSTTASAPTTPFDVERIREDFPILKRQIDAQPLVYLDNGATTQKPQSVLDAIEHYYQHYNSNVHRGAHCLSDEATHAFEQAREKVRAFLNARHAHEIIWTKGTTESINLVAASFGKAEVQAGDNVVISAMEHHSNIVPWQMLCEQAGAELRIAPVNAKGELVFDGYSALLDSRTRLVAMAHVSNALGTINPVKKIVEAAQAVGAKVLLDGAQAVSHWPTDVQALDCDFYVFSSHKLFGPTGVGILYGKEALLNTMPPYQFGGEMIEHVSFKRTLFNQLPYKFEAGTPNIAGAIGLGAAIDYLSTLESTAVMAHEAELIKYAHERAIAFDGLTIVGEAEQKTSVLSFLIDGTHPHDVGTLLDQMGVAVRTGHHCAMPIMEQFGIPGTVRASFSFYNTLDEVDALFTGLEKVRSMLL